MAKTIPEIKGLLSQLDGSSMKIEEEQNILDRVTEGISEIEGGMRTKVQSLLTQTDVTARNLAEAAQQEEVKQAIQVLAEAKMKTQEMLKREAGYAQAFTKLENFYVEWAGGESIGQDSEIGKKLEAFRIARRSSRKDESAGAGKIADALVALEKKLIGLVRERGDVEAGAGVEKKYWDLAQECATSMNNRFGSKLVPDTVFKFLATDEDVQSALDSQIASANHKEQISAFLQQLKDARIAPSDTKAGKSAGARMHVLQSVVPAKIDVQPNAYWLKELRQSINDAGLLRVQSSTGTWAEFYFKSKLAADEKPEVLAGEHVHGAADAYEALVREQDWDDFKSVDSTPVFVHFYSDTSISKAIDALPEGSALTLKLRNGKDVILRKREKGKVVFDGDTGGLTIEDFRAAPTKHMDLQKGIEPEKIAIGQPVP